MFSAITFCFSFSTRNWNETAVCAHAIEMRICEFLVISIYFWPSRNHALRSSFQSVVDGKRKIFDRSICVIPAKWKEFPNKLCTQFKCRNFHTKPLPSHSACSAWYHVIGVCFFFYFRECCFAICGNSQKEVCHELWQREINTSKYQTTILIGQTQNECDHGQLIDSGHAIVMRHQSEKQRFCCR